VGKGGSSFVCERIGAGHNSSAGGSMIGVSIRSEFMVLSLSGDGARRVYLKVTTTLYLCAAPSGRSIRECRLCFARLVGLFVACSSPVRRRVGGRDGGRPSPAKARTWSVSSSGEAVFQQRRASLASRLDRPRRRSDVAPHREQPSARRCGRAPWTGCGRQPWCWRLPRRTAVSGTRTDCRSLTVGSPFAITTVDGRSAETGECEPPSEW